MTLVPDIPNPTNLKGIAVLDLEGGQTFIMPVEITTNNAIDTGDQLAVGGLQLTTSGVSDSTNKRFVTDAELAQLVDMSDAALGDVATELAALGALEGAEVLLASNALVDLNTATASTIYTVATGKSAVITRIVLRLASTSLTTASISIGFNSASFNDVIANATHTELTGNTLYTVLAAKAGAKIGTTGQALKLLCNTLQGGAATATVEVFGYLF